MHRSYNPVPGRETLGLSAYWDDCGSDNLSAVTTIGGPIVSNEASQEFNQEWDKMLAHYHVAKPLHMKDFTGSGKYAGMYPELKMALFSNAVDLINTYKLYSLSVSVIGAEFNSVLTDEVRKNILGPYGMCFFAAALATHEVSSHSLIVAAERTAYIVDTGFGYSDQLRKAHDSIIDVHKTKNRSCFCGPLMFAPDDDIPALQAADIIAWTARKIKVGGLREGFEPLREVLAAERSSRASKNWMAHAHIDLPKSALEMFAKPINNWLSLGALPSLRQILR
jgi:hypothetical protein